MGRIKTKMVKRLAFQLFNKHQNYLKENFEDNKKVVESFMSNPSKKIRNTVAGYVTRLMKTRETL